jgi:hypothetical protein
MSLARAKDALGGLARRLTGQGPALPQIAALCLDFDTPRHARVELRIVRPAARADWRVRQITWLDPVEARIALRPDDPDADLQIETALAPRDAAGRWFAGDPVFWVRYARQRMPVHQARLRLDLEWPGERRARLTLSPVFPAMDWPRPRLAPAEIGSGGLDARPLESRSWELRTWDGWNPPGLA